MKYLIIGGDAAGMSAAMQIVRAQKQAEITVIEQGEYYSYAQCGLPYLISGEVEDAADLVARPRATFREKYGIDARVRQQAQALDTAGKTVVVADLESGRQLHESYDKLLLAMGARARKPAWPGVDLAGVHVLKAIPDALAIKAMMAQVDDVVVIGGGYVGLEAVEALRHIGKSVRLLHRSGKLGANFDEDMAALILEEAQNHGVQVHLNEQVQRLKGSGRVSTVHTDKGSYPAQLVLVAVGVEPNTQWVDGLAKHESGAILVDNQLRTSQADIFAAGDCATQYHRIKGTQDYVPLGTTANKQGALAGQIISGQQRHFAGIVGTGVMRFFGLTLARTGLSSAEAHSSQRQVDSVMIKARDKAGYMPDAGALHVKLLYDQESKELLGGQLIGPGADKRIDVLATALFHGMTVPDLLHLDLSYAPPFNGVWDPIQQAARRV